MRKPAGKVRGSRGAARNRCEVIKRIQDARQDLVEMQVESLSLFGSFARDEAGPKSDVDLVVEFSAPVGMFHLFNVKVYLEKLLGRPVDLVLPEALRAEFRPQIERELIRAA